MKSTSSNLPDKLGFLKSSSMINTTLQNTAAMAMGSNRNAVGSNGIKNELGWVS